MGEEERLEKRNKEGRWEKTYKGERKEKQRHGEGINIYREKDEEEGEREERKG